MGLTPHPSCSIPSGFDAFGAFGASFTSARVQLMTSVLLLSWRSDSLYMVLLKWLGM